MPVLDEEPARDLRGRWLQGLLLNSLKPIHGMRAAAMTHIQNGYRANGMDERYLERALMQSMTEQEERIRQEELDEEEDFVMGLE